MTDSRKLLADYVRNGSDAAFLELVTRYVDLVYPTALRLVAGDSHRAKDVAQTVFVDLARKARALSNDVMLGGWLHRHTFFVATTLLRGERRRQFRERQAVEMYALRNDSEADFSLLAPILDEAVNELSEPDRTAILLRFFEKYDFQSVGRALGANEDAARMRVTRALEKLEVLLKRKGVTARAAGLGLALSANAVQAAPAGLTVAISTAAFAGTTATMATHTMNLINTKTIVALVATALVAGTGTHLLHQREAINLRREDQNLMARAQALTAERDSALAAARAGRDELEQSRKDRNELLRLRGEVGMLRKQTNELQALSAENGRLRSRLAEQHPATVQPEQAQADSFIFVSGQVSFPNRRLWRTGMSLKSAIEAVGGFTDAADKTKIQITREDGTSSTLNYSETGGSTPANTTIFPGDKIFIPQSPK